MVLGVLVLAVHLSGQLLDGELFSEPESAGEAGDPLEDHQKSTKEVVEPTENNQETDEDTSPHPNAGVTDSPAMSAGDPEISLIYCRKLILTMETRSQNRP